MKVTMTNVQYLNKKKRIKENYETLQLAQIGWIIVQSTSHGQKRFGLD